MIRIAIADDHVMFRDGLKRLLETEPLMELVGEASDGREAVDMVRKTSPDVLLLDVSMPGRDGLEIVQELKQHDPRLRILMLTAHPEDHYAIRCLKSGADGYMTKQQAVDELIAAIRKVYSGGKYISSTLAETLALSLQTDFGKAPHEILSDREFQVMRMIASGMTVSEVAAELCLSVKTISTYRTRILEKMQLKNNAQITQYCLKEDLV
jgi:two-component system, NarL family, invasion response regulator UvrY